MKLIPRGPLTRNFGWMLMGQCTCYVLRIIGFILIARILGVLQYGIVVGAFALVNFAAQYSRLGTGVVFLRYVSADRSQFPAYWGNLLFVTFGAGSILILALHIAAPHLIDPASAGIVLLTAIGTCLCEQLSISATQAFQAFEKMPATAVLNLLTSLTRAVTAAIMLVVMHHATAMQWALASLAGSIVAAAIAIVAVSIYFGRPQFSTRMLQKRAGEGIEYAFATSTTLVYDDLDKMMLSHFGMTAALGAYALAYRVVDVATLPILSLQMASEPRLFQLGASNPPELVKVGYRLLSRGVVLSCAAAVSLYLFAPIVPLVAGPGFDGGVAALRWLCLIPVCRSVHYITGSILTCAGLQRYRTATQVTAAVLNFGLNLWLIPAYNWYGAAWASLITDSALGVLTLAVLSVALVRPAVSLKPECP